jgi:hypothetical protein
MLKTIRKAREELNDILTAGLPKKDLDALVDSLLRMKSNIADTRTSAKVA